MLIYPISGGADDDTVEGGGGSGPTAAKGESESATTLDPKALLAEIDRRLQERDQAILAGFQKIGEFLQQAKPAGDSSVADESAAISPQDFWQDPNKAMEAFYKTKIAPALEKPAGSDPAVLTTKIDVEVMKLRDHVGADQWNRYRSWFAELAKHTDPKVLAAPGGVDAIYRLAKSYADENESRQEAERHQRNRRANLEAGGGEPGGSGGAMKLNEEEKALAERMGISPELWMKHVASEDVEIGGRRNKKQ